MKELRDFEEEEVVAGDEIAIETGKNLGFLVNWRNLWGECEICVVFVKMWGDKEKINYRDDDEELKWKKKKNYMGYGRVWTQNLRINQP